MRKKVMREVVIKICDYCGEEIKDYSWSGGDTTDFHSMYSGGHLGNVKETCLDKYNKEQLEKAEKGEEDENKK